MYDEVEHPSHYQAGDYEAKDVINALLGNSAWAYWYGCAFKYLWRCQFKGYMLKDIRKCIQCLSYMIECLPEDTDGAISE